MNKLATGIEPFLGKFNILKMIQFFWKEFLNKYLPIAGPQLSGFALMIREMSFWPLWKIIDIHITVMIMAII